MARITINQIISAKNLLKRWRGLTESELLEIVYSPTTPSGVVEPRCLTAYLHIKTIVTPDCEKIHYCEDNYEASLPIIHNVNGAQLIDWKDGDVSLGVVFDLRVVEELEEVNPLFFCDIETETDRQGAKTNRRIKCDVLAERWGCSEELVFEIVTKERLNHYTDYDVPPFALGLFSAYYVDYDELKQFENKNARLITVLSSPDKGGISTQKRVAVIKDYSEKMDGIVFAVLAIKKKWDKLPAGSPAKLQGFSEQQLADCVNGSVSRELLRQMKHALNKAGIKVWLKSKPRRQK